MESNVEFRIEPLDENIRVCVSNEHSFGTDAFLLADFAGPKHSDLVCDLGTGCGIIPMLMARNTKPYRVVGVDIQEQAIEQFRRSVELSNLSIEVVPMLSDLNSLDGLAPASFDVVTCNPPYKAGNTGILSSNEACKLARHEVSCTMNDVCKAAKRLLKFGGKLCICQRPERLADVILAMRENDIEPKRLRFVAKNKDSEPWLFLIEGKRGSKPSMRVLPSLFLYDEGGYSIRMQEIYRGESSNSRQQ